MILKGDTGILTPSMANKELRQNLQDAIKALDSRYQMGSAEKLLKINKSIIVEMFTDNGAEWLKKTILTETVTKKWGIKYVPQRFPLLVKFMPIKCDPDKDRTKILKNNQLTDTMVTELKWMKPTIRQHTTQKVANLLLTVTDKDTTNYISAKGLYIDGSYQWTKKMMQEPMRCNKCQFYRHMAKECRQKDNTCVYCGGKHRSNNCDRSKGKYCKSCNRKGHTATERICPTFIKKCREYNARNPSNTMPFC